MVSELLGRNEGFILFVANNVSVCVEDVSSLSTCETKFASSVRLITRDVSKSETLSQIYQKSLSWDESRTFFFLNQIIESPILGAPMVLS